MILLCILDSGRIFLSYQLHVELLCKVQHYLQILFLTSFKILVKYEIFIKTVIRIKFRKKHTLTADSLCMTFQYILHISTFDSSIFSTYVFRLLRYHRDCGWHRSNDLVLRLLLFVHHQGVEGQEVATTSLDSIQNPFKKCVK